MNTTIAILGAGNLGVAIANGIHAARLAEAAHITLVRRNTARLEAMREAGFRVTDDAITAVKESSVILICVQPKQAAGVLERIAPYVEPDRHVVVSTMTGVTTDKLQGWLLDKPVAIVRAMPNTAVAIGSSMTCLCASNASAEQLAAIERLFQGVGHTLIIEERLMKAATVLAASGIAFFMRYLRAATQGGVQLGFDSEESQAIAVQTAKGAALLLQALDSHPELEIDKVTTPEGCTIAGLNEMEHQGLSSALIKGILTSFEKINTITS